MTNFGLTDGYHVHDGLDQKEVFLSLLWCIFYDPLLCKVKRQESVCGYRLNFHFVAKTGHVESQAVGSSQTATQHILDVASEFFRINDISINNDKTVAIPINSRASALSLFISESPISIAKPGKSHCYLGIFVFSEGLLKPSLAKAYLDWWKRLDPHGPTSEWFMLSVKFLSNTFSPCAPSPALADIGLQSILTSLGFVLVHNRLSQVLPSSISVYTDGSLTNLGTKNCMAGAGVFFSDIDLGLGIGVLGLLFSTLAEMQTIVLALECVPCSSCVYLFSDSQAALNACKLELDIVHPDFRNLKGHSGIIGNECADAIAGASSHSGWFFPSQLHAHFLLADSGAVSGNSRYFVRDIFCSVSRVHWETGSGSKFLPASLFADVDWSCSSLVWHPDSHMAAGHTSKPTADAHSFLMKALHHQLPVVVRKHLYNRRYSSVLCLYCGEVETSDHVFSCKADVSICLQILDTCSKSWMVLSGLSLSSFCMLQLLSSYAFDVSVFMALSKGFVFIEWLHEAVSVFKCYKAASLKIVEFVHSLSFAFRNNIWLVRVKHRAFMEKNNLIPLDGSVSISVPGSVSRFSAGVVRLLGMAKALGVRFGFRKQCSFFSGISDSVLVHITV
ncbi:hypothetical protein G9A89_021259 [Geosiphon pyriformis]|nr:hypothetical protein G9A89_021259 [Geosiphon pyriformis]